MATPFCAFKTLSGFGFQFTKVLPLFREWVLEHEYQLRKYEFRINLLIDSRLNAIKLNLNVILSSERLNPKYEC